MASTPDSSHKTDAEPGKAKFAVTESVVKTTSNEKPFATTFERNT